MVMPRYSEVDPGLLPGFRPSDGSLSSAMDNLARQMERLSDLLTSAPQSPGSIPVYGQPVQFSQVSLFTANVWKEITVPAGMRFCTAYCDGAMNGVKVALKNQSNTPVELDRFPTFEIQPDVNRVYISSDVRPGRSILILAFSATYPTTATLEHPEFLELAARTNALPTYDRRGQLLWQDDFESTQLKWTPVITGGVAHIGLTAANPYRGNQCVRVATDALLNDNAYMYHRLPVPINKQVGFEIAVCFDAAFDDAYVDISARIDNGTAYYDAHLKLIRVATAWSIQYVNSAGADVSLSTSWAPSASYHIVKLVLDAATGRWIRGLVDDQQFNLAGIAMQTGASANQQMDLKVDLKTTGAGQREITVDNCILTHNEPIDVLIS